MSEDDMRGRYGRRAAAGALLGGLLAGAALGVEASEQDKSIRDQIAESFAPGARDTPSASGWGPPIVVVAK
jgi:hypothetical protein